MRWDDSIILLSPHLGLLILVAYNLKTKYKKGWAKKTQ